MSRLVVLIASLIFLGACCSPCPKKDVVLGVMSPIGPMLLRMPKGALDDLGKKKEEKREKKELEKWEGLPEERHQL